MMKKHCSKSKKRKTIRTRHEKYTAHNKWTWTENRHRHTSRHTHQRHRKNLFANENIWWRWQNLLFFLHVFFLYVPSLSLIYNFAIIFSVLFRYFTLLKYEVCLLRVRLIFNAELYGNWQDGRVAAVHVYMFFSALFHWFIEYFWRSIFAFIFCLSFFLILSRFF